MVANKLSEYPLARSKREAERLHKQHVWQQICLNDQIVFAPVDLQKQGLKVLDVGCAEGRYYPQTSNAVR
jgi:2-polyprenyl-3-methyl-5-hydroxy-6-metoxy-1,4-benzoquinol methylase